MNEAQQGIYGIDLGTTYSVVGYIDETGRSAVTRNSDGQDTTPSVVYFETADNIVVGKVAKESAGRVPGPGRVADQAGDGRQGLAPGVLRQGVHAAVHLGADPRARWPRTRRRTRTGRSREVVITVPAYFGLLEKDATRQAGEIAGLKVIGIVPEPVAAALHYGVTGSADGTTFLVYDLGGGTFDISLIKMTETSVEVLAVGGNSRLGGADWDEKLFDSHPRPADRGSGATSRCATTRLELQDLRNPHRAGQEGPVQGREQADHPPLQRHGRQGHRDPQAVRGDDRGPARGDDPHHQADAGRGRAALPRHP